MWTINGSRRSAIKEPATGGLSSDIIQPHNGAKKDSGYQVLNRKSPCQNVFSESECSLVHRPRPAQCGHEQCGRNLPEAARIKWKHFWKTRKQ